MSKEEIRTAFGKVMPTAAQKAEMLDAVLAQKASAVGAFGLRKRKRRIYFSTVTACLALIFTVTFAMPAGSEAAAFGLSVMMGDGSTVSLEGTGSTDAAGMVSYVNSGPELRFFITGTDIAKVEISSENEFVSAHDFTETLDEKCWNPELYYVEKEIDGVVYQYVPSRSLFESSLTLTFPEGFEKYDQVWYSWYGWNLREWAVQDGDAHIQGAGGLSVSETQELLENASEEEKLAIAAGGGSLSAAGHILLEGYPEEKLQDRVTIAITDRQGNTVTQVLHVRISNNLLGQTVLTAGLSEKH